VLGLIFLRYADVRFTVAEKDLAGKATGRKEIGKADYQAKGVMYVPETARFSYLKALPEGTDIGQALNDAMETIEADNPDLQSVLPRDYARFDSSLLAELLRLIGSIPDDIEGDAFGKIYEYFLRQLRSRRGSRGRYFLHAYFDRQADRRHHRAVQGSDP
jgi:type I restriction enzyme M protein